MKIAAVTTLYDPSPVVDLWERYYTKQGVSTYIIDLRGRKFCEIDKDAEITNKHRSLLGEFDLVIVGDPDEFVVPNPVLYKGIVDYCENRSEKAAVTKCVGVHVIQHDDALPEVDWTRPVIRQRPFGLIDGGFSKPILTSIPVKWVPGFHSCAESSFLDTDLFMFHLKWADITQLLRHLEIIRSMEWSKETLGIHCFHMRWSNEEMMFWLHLRQQMREDRDLNSLPIRDIVEKGSLCPLVRINDEFMEVL